MSLRPIDVQTVIPKTPEVGAQQQAREQAAQAAQAQFAAELQTRKEAEGRQVKTAPKAEGGKVADGPGRRGEKREKRRDGSGGNSPGEESGAPDPKAKVGRLLDIRM